MESKKIVKLGEGRPIIVIPTIRSEEVFTKFMDAWKQEFQGCHIIVVEDRKKKILDPLMSSYSGFTYEIFDWKDIDKDLKEKAWIIPRQTDCVRSYGYYKAWQQNPLFIVTLDDDVLPERYHKDIFNNKTTHIAQFYNNLFIKKYPNHNFYNTMKGNHLPRGTYIDSAGCDVSHGCWTNVPDFSAVEHSKNPYITVGKEAFNEGLVPKGAYVSLCGMNLAWKPFVTKHMYFGLQGGDYPIDRCGDIWCGYRLCKEGYKIYTGGPYCQHNKASNLWTNMKKEANAEEMSLQIVDGEPFWSEEAYGHTLEKAEKVWESLFENGK